MSCPDIARSVKSALAGQKPNLVFYNKDLRMNYAPPAVGGMFIVFCFSNSSKVYVNIRKSI